MYRVWHPPCCLNHVTHVGSYAANVPHLVPGDFLKFFFDFLRFFTLGFLVQIYCKQVPPDIKVAFWNFLGHKSDFLRFFWLPPLLFTLPILTFWDCRWHKSDFLRFFVFFWTYTCHFIALLNVFCTCSFLCLLIFCFFMWFFLYKFGLWKKNFGFSFGEIFGFSSPQGTHRPKRPGTFH